MFGLPVDRGFTLEIIKAITLGIVQGLTEFLPVSSSGHLVIGSELLQFHEQGVVFDVFLHLGTLLSVIFVFRDELLAMIKAPFLYMSGRRDQTVKRFFLWDVYVVIATLPAVVVGLTYKDEIEQLFSSVLVAYCMLIVTGAMMIIARFLPEKQKTITWWRSLLVGCAQAFAILPGISRSGSTIFTGMALGVPRETIARFSFIMSIPAILGAAVLQTGELLENPPGSDVWVTLVAGTFVASVSGYCAIKLLLDIIRKNRLQWFGYYCLVVASIGLIHHFFFAV